MGKTTAPYSSTTGTQPTTCSNKSFDGLQRKTWRCGETPPFVAPPSKRLDGGLSFPATALGPG
jgi:hypothetical protein